MFPLALSVVTMAFTLTMYFHLAIFLIMRPTRSDTVTVRIFLDINFKNAVTARPPFELGWLLLFGALWLGMWYISHIVS